MYDQNLTKGVAFLQKAEIVVVILAIAPVAAAVLSLLEACVKLMTTIIDARFSHSKSRKIRKNKQKK